MRKRFFALVTLLLLAVFGLACQPRRSGSGRSLKRVNLVGSESGVSFADENFRFSIRGLNNKWRLLTEEERSAVLPDAVVMVAQIGGSYGAVIVEPFATGNLEEFSEIIRSTMGGALIGTEMGDLRWVEFNGGKACRWNLQGLAQGVEMNYEVMTFLHQGMAYQVLAWQLGKAEDQSTMEEFFASFGIEEGRVKFPQPPSAPDAIGIGSRFSGGRFESAVSQLVVDPAENWGLLWGKSLQLQDTGAEMETGVLRPDMGIYITVSHQPISQEESEHYVATSSAAFAETLSQTVTRTMRFADRPVEFIGGDFSGPPAIRLYVGHTVRGDRGYRIQVWHLKSGGPDLFEEIEEGLSSFSMLSEGEAEELRAVLESTAVGDLTASVGEEFSVRGGVFRDFRYGFVWKQPAGFWQLRSGDDAILVNPDARLHATEVERGINFQWFAEDAGGFDSKDFHELLVARLSERGFTVDGADLEPLTVDGREILRTRLSFEPEGVEYHLATVVSGGKAHQLNCFGPKSAMAANEKFVVRILEGCAFPEERLKAVEESRGSLHRDVRMGFELRMDNGMILVPPRLEPRIQHLVSKLGNATAFRSKEGEILHMAVFYTQFVGDAAVAANLVDQVYSLNFDRAGGTEAQDTIAGLPATVRSVSSDGVHFRIVSFWTGRTVHIGIVGSSNQRTADRLYSEYKKGFSLVP